MSSKPFTPPGVKYALIGSSMIGALMAVPIFIVALVISHFIYDSPYGFGSLAIFAVAVGVGYSWLGVILTRPLQFRQQTVLPSGPAATLLEICSPLLVGPLISFLMSRAVSPSPMDPLDSLCFGALTAGIGFLPELLFISQPWKKKLSQEEIDEMNREFKEMTLERINEYKQEVAEKAEQRRIQRYGDPWRQEHRQGWWKQDPDAS